MIDDKFLKKKFHEIQKIDHEILTEGMILDK